MTELRALLDTNILVYAVHTDSPFYKTARAFVTETLKGARPCCVCPQVMWEFFAIVTDAKRISSPLTTAQAFKEMNVYWDNPSIEKIFSLPHAITTLEKLSRRYPIMGQHIHDAHLIATMIDNSVTTLYSADTGLAQYREIKVINPFV